MYIYLKLVACAKKRYDTPGTNFIIKLILYVNFQYVVLTPVVLKAQVEHGHPGQVLRAPRVHLRASQGKLSA